MAQKNKKRVFSRLLKMAMPYTPQILISTALGSLGHISAIGLTGFAAAAIATIILTKEISILFVTLTLISGLIRGLCRLGEHYFGHDVAFRLLFSLRMKVFKALSRLAPAKLIDRRNGDLCSSIISDVEFIETFFAHTIAPIAIATIVSSTVLISVAFISPLFTLLLIPFYSGVGVIIPIIAFKNYKERGSNYRSELANFNSQLLENMQGIKELLLLNQAEEKFKEIMNQAKKSEKIFFKIKKQEGLINALGEILITTYLIAAIILSYFLIIEGTISFPLALIAITITSGSFGPLLSLLGLSNTLLLTSASATRIFELMDEEPNVKNRRNAKNFPENGNSARLDEVSFSYPKTNKKILENISINIPPNKISALGGKSGRGKSTILYMIMRFWDSQSGEVAIQDENVKNIDLSQLRENISYFTQNTWLFNTTVRENIGIAKEDATDEEIIIAAKKAGIHNHINSLSKKYETVTGEEGGHFSSGERQRIGLARIFLQDNDLVLLDEPASNLDTENEQIILDGIEKGLKNKTVVLISHRERVKARALTEIKL